MREIVIPSSVRDDLKKAVRFIALDNPDSADRFLESINSILVLVSQFPQIGKLTNRPPTRTLVVP
jgi:plasmid stabilization system protein ParE